MNDLNNWIEAAKGFYKYIVSPNRCYEIVVLYRDFNKSIKHATAELYVTEWKKNTICSFERELLITGESVEDCLEAAVNDFKLNSN